MTKNERIGLVFAKTGSINSGTEHRAGGGGSREPRTAIELLFSAWGGLGKPNRGRGHGETFFPDSGSDRNSDETFQISQNLGHEHVEFFCLLDSQPWLRNKYFGLSSFLR
jgi:hypothetical protein